VSKISTGLYLVFSASLQSTFSKSAQNLPKPNEKGEDLMRMFYALLQKCFTKVLSALLEQMPHEIP
jgi:hypothetical protein